MSDIDIDAIMDEIDSELPSEGVVNIPEGTEEMELVVEETKAVSNPIDLDEENALANAIVQNSLDVIKNAKKVFDNFEADVFHGKDRSTSSKEAMIKALDTQNSANKNMIDLAKVLSASKEKNNGTNILINAVSEKQAGISISNIKDNL